MPLRLAVGSLLVIPSELWMYTLLRAAIVAYLLAQSVSSFPLISFGSFGPKGKSEGLSYHDSDVDYCRCIWGL